VNLHFRNRINAAARLYKAGKIKHIVVSGDNRSKFYNEPVQMKNDLLKLGVPSSAITADFAGLRTLDSVVRMRKVFNQHRFTIISQEYHNYRALFIAKHHNLDAIAYSADKVRLKHSIKTEIREYFARVKAIIDLYILNRGPKFLGKKIPIKIS